MIPVGLDEWFELVTGFKRSALHIEQHPIYVVDVPAMTPWLAGETKPPAPDYVSDTWAALVRRRVDAGGVIDRIRIHQDRPTPYQQWLRWIGARHIIAGETHRYLSHGMAAELGLLPTAPFAERDWWLLDNEQLVVFTHYEGELTAVDLHTDTSLIESALEWWDRAIRHSVVESATVT